jgi:amino acid adenylation domain-containing protein
MMDIRNLLVDFQRRGIRLVLDGDTLKSRSAPGAIDAETASVLRARKAEIISFLRQRQIGRLDERDIVPVSRTQALPLSYAQRRLWIIDQLQGSAHYIVPLSLRALGELDRAAFGAAIDAIVARHEALRTVFRQRDGDPVQEVLPARPVRVAEYDLRHLASAEQQIEVRRRSEENAQAPFDLEHDLLLRVALLRLGERCWVVLAALHHIACDGWSIDLFLREFTTLYNSVREQRESQLAPLPIQYADYAQWQRARMADPGFAARLEYWRRQLDSIPQVHGIPLDRTRPPIKQTRGVRLVQRLDALFTTQLRRLARGHDATVFMVLHTALALVVSRWSRSDDIVIGTPISGRTHQKLSSLIGFFANTLVLRTRIDPADTFVDLLLRNRTSCLEAYEHGEVPFDRIVELVQPQRSSSYTPVFQILFSLLEVDHGKLACNDLEIEVQAAQSVSALFDLDVTATPEGDGLAFRWDVDAALFDESTLHRMMTSFSQVLEQAARDAAVRVTDFDLLNRRDRELLRSWNDTTQAYPAMCLHTLIEQQTARTPERIALVCGEARLSYRELNGKANALAEDLRALGVKTGDIVPVIMRPGVEVPLSFLAVLKAGAAFAPLDAAWPAERLERALAKLASPLLLMNAAVDLDGLKSALPRRTVDWSTLGLAPDRKLELAVESPIYVMHTSGSTGVPKGALNTHRGIVNRLSFMSRYFEARGDEVVLQTTHHCFDSAVWQFFWPLIKGGTAVMPLYRHGIDLAQIAALLESHRVTLTDFSPALLGLFADHVIETGSASAREWRLRDLIVGGEEMTPAIARKCAAAFPQVRLHNFYGPSETAIGCICYGLPQDPPAVVPIGQPIDNVVVALVGTGLEPVPIGAPGEILIGGDCVGLGYVADDVSTRAAFIDVLEPISGCRRFYRSGDLGRYRSNGMLEFLGRIDSQVKIRGFRVELGEIQSALEAHPQVRQAHVRITGEGRDKQIIAWLVAERQAGFEEAELKSSLRSALGRSLPDYMIPSAYVVLKEFPLTLGGKIDWRALPVDEGVAGRAPYVEPTTPEALALARIWSELFGIDRVGLLDDFFELGGHSLLAMQVVARVRKMLQVELPLRVLFAKPRLKDSSEWCATQRGVLTAAGSWRE